VPPSPILTTRGHAAASLLADRVDETIDRHEA
jgi:hypothetical protein